MNKLTYFILACLVSAAPLFAQSEAAPSQAAPAVQTAYFLRTIDWKVNGRTKAWALKKAADIDGDEKWDNRETLEKWVKNITQLLLNERVLESVEVHYTLGEADSTGAIPVDLFVKVKDTWNVIALPKPQLDSNNGLDFSLRARDYNFLGTMEPLRLNLGYNLDSDAFKARDFSKSSVYGDIDINFPFQAAGYDWMFDFDHSLAYTSDKKVQYSNTTGLAIDVPWKETTFTFGAYQRYYLNEENDDYYQALPGGTKYFADTWYMMSSLEASWEIPTGVVVGRYGDLSYTPKATFDYKYRPFGSIGDERRGPSSTFSHSLGFSRIDWHGNFRRGLSVSLDNSNTWNYSTQSWSNSISTTLIGHRQLFKYLGVSSKLYGIYNISDTDYSAGDTLRGITDDDVDADGIATLNVDVPVSVIRFMPYEWWGVKWMKPFQFEQVWSPFVDVGAVYLKDNVKDADTLLYTGGLEVITYPAAFRSMFLRVSVGFDLRDFPGTYEYYIGLDAHY